MSAQQKPLWLCLVRYMKGLGTAGRCCLFVCEDGEPGWIYEIKVNQESLVYEPPTETTDLYPSNPWSMFVLGHLSEEQHAIVRKVAQRVPLPASTESDVNEATQTWSVQVIEELVKLDIVWSFRLEEAKSAMHDRLPKIKHMNDLKKKM